MGNSVVESRAAGSRQAVVQRYVDILTDAGLKAVFGDQRNKDVLIDILNVILPPHRKVEDIPPVYFIGLLDKDLQDMQRYSPEDGIISEYTFREKTTMKVPDETIFCIFVELNRFTKTKEECETMLDKWCFALTHIGTLDRLPDELRTEAFERLFQACEIARFEPEVKLKYEKEMITERDYYNMLNTAKADGLAEGRAEGREEGLIEGEAKGREEEKIRIAKAFKEQGVDAGIISFATGLSEAEVAEL